VQGSAVVRVKSAACAENRVFYGAVACAKDRVCARTCGGEGTPQRVRVGAGVPVDSTPVGAPRGRACAIRVVKCPAYVAVRAAVQADNAAEFQVVWWFGSGVVRGRQCSAAVGVKARYPAPECKSAPQCVKWQ